MLIRRVVIHGFKTFAKRTEFHFDAGITALVGPNGSGKSNIVDAIRWCLGEQSFSLLRSKKTSDVIFSGSDKKARLGMAQVSLLLDNSAGEIPIDYSEVEITRRAYRDGDNEYLVNGQRVRLADIADLLSQTGLGRRTYSVVGQGLIDKALSLAPDERRSLFEEAAGIAGYQAKREAAIRRLESTQANLTRVRDIAAELAPRLGYLKRQADRALEREQMAADLRGLLREWYGYKWHAALAAVENHHADALILRNTLDERAAELAALSARIEVVRRKQVDLRAVVNEHHRSAGDLHGEAQRISQELAVRNEALRQTLERREENAREVTVARVQSEAQQTRIATLRAEVVDAEATLADRRAIVAETNAALELQRANQRQLQSQVDERRRELLALQKQQSDLQSQLRQIEERERTLEAARNRLAESDQKNLSEVTFVRDRLQKAEAERAQMEARAAELAQVLEQASSERDALRKALENAENERRSADREADRLQTRYDLMRRLSTEGAGMASGVRAVMQAANNRTLSGILGPVAALLRVPAQLDKAVETALGGALQNLVAESWSDAQAAIEWLKRQQRGRATFLPLDKLNVLNAIPAPRMAGVHGNAADLVACDARVERVRNQLLNRTWIVDDLPAARRALDAMRDGGPRPTVVTLSGEIVRPGGAVTGGSDNTRGDEQSVLQRERELRELPALLQAATTRASETAALCKQYARGEAAARSRLEETQRALADLARQERTQQSALAELRRSADRLDQQRLFAADQSAQHASEESQLVNQRQQIEAHLPEVAARIAAAESSLAAAERESGSAASDELLRTLADQRAAEAQAEGALASRRALVAQHEHALADSAAQIAGREQRIAALDAEAEELRTRIESLSQEERNVRTAIAAVQSEVAPQEAEIAALEAEQRAAEAEERELQALQRRDESLWSHAQITLQRSEDAVEQLQTEIRRDLGLVALETSDDVALQQPLPLETFVETLPLRTEAVEGMEDEVVALRTRLGRLTNVNPEAPREYAEAAERHTHLTTQSDDLSAAAADLQKIIRNLDELMQTELARTFAAVAEEFGREFQKLFNGGSGELVLTDPDDIANSGIDIVARPPGKRPQSLALLSGGERALAACALIFSILRVSPTPFCVLDEVDAALDEANVDRFRLAVEELSHMMQFIVVTHNRRTLEGANTIYGITMGADGVSRVIGLRLEGEQIVRHRDDGATPPEDEGNLKEIEEVVAM